MVCHALGLGIQCFTLNFFFSECQEIAGVVLTHMYIYINVYHLFENELDKHLKGYFIWQPLLRFCALSSLGCYG